MQKKQGGRPRQQTVRRPFHAFPPAASMLSFFVTFSSLKILQHVLRTSFDTQSFICWGKRSAWHLPTPTQSHSAGAALLFQRDDGRQGPLGRDSAGKRCPESSRSTVTGAQSTCMAPFPKARKIPRPEVLMQKGAMEQRAGDVGRRAVTWEAAGA